MRKLKVLILSVGDDVDSLNQIVAVLKSRYGIEKPEIVRGIEQDKSSVQADYVIVSGGGYASETSDCATLKQTLAEQMHVPSEAIIFDFEICNETFSFPKVCLVVIFNHRFDRNLPLLRKIYGGRFSNVRFLMPFYDGTDTDVIPVYESPDQFHGYLIQAYDKLTDLPCTHYLFIGDDLIIHPDFDETNFVARTNMYGKKFLDAKFSPLNSPNKFRWCWTAGSSQPFYNAFTSWRSSLYTYEEAMTKFNEFFGTKYKEAYDEAFFGNPNEPGWTVLGSWNNPQGFVNVVNYFLATNGNTLHIPYPMAGGYSDIFCIDKESLFKFSRLCGIFSAMNMFVEIATPTAVVLTYKRDEVTFFPKDSLLILWGDDREIFADKYGRDFNRLYNEWQENIFCVHPVKLSGWTV